jgi:uncharacterized DUF497 family protein
LDERQFQFQWDKPKAIANLRKHGVSFELASTIFQDPRLLTVADLEHSEIEERWFSVGCAREANACQSPNPRTSRHRLRPEQPRKHC